MIDAVLIIVDPADRCGTAALVIQNIAFTFAELDRGTYPTGIKVSNATLAALNIVHDAFHGDWNYILSPKKK